MKIYSIYGILFILLAAVQITPSAGLPQVLDTNWTTPFQLSSSGGQVSNPVIFSDSFGYVHVFWIESGFSDYRSIIEYSRFDGNSWSLPVDIYATNPNVPITYLSACADQNGILHLVFTESSTGPTFYTNASIDNALSAHNWKTPERLDISADRLVLKADDNGVLHLLFSVRVPGISGVYYMHSDDSGGTWTVPVVLDPDIPMGMIPSSLQLEIGEGNSLHAVWFYVDSDAIGKWVRYAHSFDNGQSWSAPFTIDFADQSPDELRLADPELAVSGENVLVIWAGDSATHREYRYSEDNGFTWNSTTRIFGDLLGQALGDGVIVDAAGRVHFFGQIRWPMGIYSAVWKAGHWSNPNLVYFIKRSDSDPIGDRIEAHNVRAAIRAGNQIILIFTSPPSSPQVSLYVMTRYLNNLSNIPISTRSIPTLRPTQTLGNDISNSNLILTTKTPITGLVQTDPTETYLDSSRPNYYSTSQLLLWGLFPAILLLIGFCGFFLINKKH